jgi:hypothetical protein
MNNKDDVNIYCLFVCLFVFTIVDTLIFTLDHWKDPQC